MKQIVIFGTGKGAELVKESLTQKAEILAYLDNDQKKIGTKKNGIDIVQPCKIDKYEYDYVIISSVRYEEIKRQLLSIGISEKNIICFFDTNQSWLKEYEQEEWLNIATARVLSYNQIMQVRMEKLEKRFNNYMNNIVYEVAENIQKDKYFFPKIMSNEKALGLIVNQKYSLTRFGDGEFEIILNRDRPKFQKKDLKLGKRLKEILLAQDDHILVGIADNYGDLSKYESDCADAIRSYLTPNVRNEHLALLSEERWYCNAYMTRPYLIYKDKENAARRFEALKSIWNNQRIVVIEGYGTRMGYKNDLFSNVTSIERILCPSENAWGKYDDILKMACQQDQDKLILISLGPTATVLAYDLYKKGFWALDVGHIDNEYEWFIRGSLSRIDIPYKYVNEYSGGDHVEDIQSEWYESQVIGRI